MKTIKYSKATALAPPDNNILPANPSRRSLHVTVINGGPGILTLGGPYPEGVAVILPQALSSIHLTGEEWFTLVTAPVWIHSTGPDIAVIYAWEEETGDTE